MPNTVSPDLVRSWLSDGQELAFLDVREHGQYGEAHPFFVVPAPYSVFESRLAELVPRPKTRVVLVDDGDGIAARAARQAEAMGYGSINILDGGAPAWAAAGHTLYAGVNVPSKTFGELLEVERHTPRLSADEVRQLQQSEADHIILDGRPFSEYAKFNIPGGICCPNGELALRVGDLVPSSATTIVINCAGRTRSILGAQTLIDAGIPNPVFALENGTQGWFLAGLQLERGATERHTDEFDSSGLDARRAEVERRAKRAGAKFISASGAAALCADADRTTYLIDVRTAEEFAAGTAAGAIHAPGGQLVQATDQWIGVRGAHIVLFDDDMIRAPLVAYWLSQLGHDAYVVDGGLAAAKSIVAAQHCRTGWAAPTVLSIEAGGLPDHNPQIVDIRASMTYREGHIEGALWSIRPRLDRLGLDPARPVVLVGDETAAALAAHDLTAAGAGNVSRLRGGPDDWRGAGLTIVASSDQPADADCIDFLFFTSERHNGNEAASRQYLAWEIGLVDQLDDLERNSFNIVGD